MKLGKHATDFLSHYSTRAVVIGFGLIVALMLVLLVFTLYRIDGIGVSYNEIVAEHNRHSAMAYKMQSTARDRTNLLLEIVYDTNAFSQNEKVQRFYELGTQFGEARKKLLSYQLKPEEMALLKQQHEVTLPTMRLQEQIVVLVQSGQQKEALRLLVGEAISAQGQVRKVLNQLFQYQSDEVQEVLDSVARLQHQAFFYILFGGLAAILLAILIGAVVSQTMSALLTRLGGTARELEQSLNELGFQKRGLDEHAIVSITDAQGRITYVNDKFCQVSQYSANELLGQNHHLMNSGYHPKDFFADMWQTITSGKVWQGEVCNHKKDGSFYWVATTIVPFLDEAGKPYQYVAIRTEITQIKEAEQVLKRGKEELEGLVRERTTELKEREEVLRLITSAAQDAIVMVDNDGKVSFWNNAAETVFGYSSGEMLGKNPHDFIAPQRYHEQQREGFSRFAHSGEGGLINKTTEVEALRKDGSTFFADVSLSSVKIRGKWHGIGIVRDVTNRKRAEENLKLQAMTDALTGIANRRLFNSFLETEMRRATRHHLPLAAMVMDIDHFKQINDAYGHQVGDDVLVELTRLVSGKIREHDFFARWGGEEFVILSPNCDVKSMRLLAEKLRAAVEMHAFPGISRVTCSFGLTEYCTGDSAKNFIGRADAGLYRAKGNGRNRVEMA